MNVLCNSFALQPVRMLILPGLTGNAVVLPFGVSLCPVSHKTTVKTFNTRFIYKEHLLLANEKVNYLKKKYYTYAAKY